MTFLFELANARTAFPLDDKRRARLDYAHSHLLNAVNMFHENSTRSAMVALNGAWAAAERALKECQQPDPTPPTAGEQDMTETKRRATEAFAAARDPARWAA